MMNIFKIFKKNNNDFSDFDEIVLKMCNGDAPLHDADSYRMFFKYKNHIYGMWFANGVDGMTLYNIDGVWINTSLQKALKIHKKLRIKLWDRYGNLYKRLKSDSQFKETKDFEEKYGLKITK